MFNESVQVYESFCPDVKRLKIVLEMFQCAMPLMLFNICHIFVSQISKHLMFRRLNVALSKAEGQLTKWCKNWKRQSWIEENMKTWLGEPVFWCSTVQKISVTKGKKMCKFTKIHFKKYTYKTSQETVLFKVWIVENVSKEVRK